MSLSDIVFNYIGPATTAESILKNNPLFFKAATFQPFDIGNVTYNPAKIPVVNIPTSLPKATITPIAKTSDTAIIQSTLAKQKSSAQTFSVGSEGQIIATPKPDATDIKSEIQERFPDLNPVVNAPDLTGNYSVQEAEYVQPVITQQQAVSIIQDAFAPKVISSVASATLKTAKEQKLKIMSASPDTPLREYTTDEFKKARYEEWLDDNTSLNLSESQKDLIKKYAWDSIPFISQRQISGAAVASFYEKLEQLQKGVENPEAYNDPVTKFFLGAEYRLPGFGSASDDEQKEALRILTKVAVENDLPVGFLSQAQQILLSELPTGSDKQAIVRYIESGELENDLKQDTAWYVPNQAKMYAMTREGQMTIGAGFTAMAVVGGALTGGVATAVVGLGMAQFQATELANLFGGDIWRTKEDLKMSGDLAYERLNEYDEEKQSVVKLLGSYDANKDKYIDSQTGEPDEAKRVQAYNEVLDAYRQLKVDLGDNAVYLSTIKGYETAVKELEWLASQIDSLADYTPKSTLPTPITIIPPEGGYVESSEFSAGKDTTIDLSMKGSGTLSYKKYDAKGNLVGSEDISYFPGVGPIVKDHSSDIAFKSLKEETAKEPTPIVPGTIYLNPGQMAQMGDKTWYGGSSGSIAGFEAPAGSQVSIKFTNADGASDVLNTIMSADTPNVLQKEIDAAFVKQQPITKGIVNLDLSSKAQLYVGVNPISKAHNGSGLVLNEGTYTFTVKEPGKEDEVKTVYVKGGETQTFAVVGKEPYEASSGGGSSGGGGDSGSSGKAAEDPYGYVTYGPTCEGATIFQDAIQIAPELGKKYAVLPGYHSIEMEKKGFETWAKTINLFKGDTVTISPYFTPVEGTTDDTDDTDDTTTTIDEIRRIYINGEPVGGKILVNDGFTGEWSPSYIDLAFGIYRIGILKTGYKLVETYVWVAETTLWGQNAKNMASAAGESLP